MKVEKVEKKEKKEDCNFAVIDSVLEQDEKIEKKKREKKTSPSQFAS